MRTHIAFLAWLCISTSPWCALKRIARGSSTSLDAPPSLATLPTTISLLQQTTPSTSAENRLREKLSRPVNPPRSLFATLSETCPGKLNPSSLSIKKSLKRSVQRARVVSRVHPHAPENLETLVLPPAYIRTNTNNEPFLLWDSEYDMVHRRTLLFGTVDCNGVLSESGNTIYCLKYLWLIVI